MRRTGAKIRRPRALPFLADRESDRVKKGKFAAHELFPFPAVIRNATRRIELAREASVDQGLSPRVQADRFHI